MAKASFALGFVKRFCWDIPEYHTLCALVETILEYGSLVRLPYNGIYKNKIESCLHHLTMFALKNSSVSNNYATSSYSTRLGKLNMQSFQRFRINASLPNVHCLRPKLLEIEIKVIWEVWNISKPSTSYWEILSQCCLLRCAKFQTKSTNFFFHSKLIIFRMVRFIELKQSLL